ncbi:N-acetyl-gamma-glutamyl-phosphate reductase [Flexibacter flexilis DSM 6793]|uniref:N-acetyl-gamma-glutamyl-phosphate reductase n=1 Tax=Flexibacter flexilis DSM 6793 TaxID=927664 RepID=A0A1I1F3D4_9BACT|nr:N-acetyl-gamma-glutamyl-phosphate reductase [Flexibacter flexilis]SFB93452.1 N-acetyl-gamma-glutamyl-phosphate reductase [Flexibacter flexilis DSM 6793]
MKIKAGIIGAAGYTGGETIRLLLGHPFAELIFANSKSQAGKYLYEIHRDLVGETQLRFCDDTPKVDVLFLCLSHGESRVWLSENTLDANTFVIDMGNDFRLDGQCGDREFVYGLVEYQRDVIRMSQNIANPGCFATAIQLGLLPLAQQGLLSEVYTTGVTGSTGAGQKLQETSHFSWRLNNISPYKTLTHQHLDEMQKTLVSLQPNFGKNIYFTPWRGDFARGIFTSSMLTITHDLKEIYHLYKEYYAESAFTFVLDKNIDLKQVVNTNKCVISLEKEGDKLVIHTAIDNLLKGASGQAIQNMNLMFGIEETAGLKLKSIVY